MDPHLGPPASESSCDSSNAGGNAADTLTTYLAQLVPLLVPTLSVADVQICCQAFSDEIKAFASGATLGRLAIVRDDGGMIVRGDVQARRGETPGSLAGIRMCADVSLATGVTTLAVIAKASPGALSLQPLASQVNVFAPPCGRDAASDPAPSIDGHLPAADFTSLGTAQAALEALVIPLLQRASSAAHGIGGSAASGPGGSALTAEGRTLAAMSRQASQLLQLLSQAVASHGGSGSLSLPALPSTMLSAEPELAETVRRCVAAGRLLPALDAGVPEALFRDAAFVGRLEASLVRWRGTVSRVIDAPSERAAAAAAEASAATAASRAAWAGDPALYGAPSPGGADAPLPGDDASGGLALLRSIAAEAAFLLAWEGALGELVTQLSAPTASTGAASAAAWAAASGTSATPAAAAALSAAAYGVALSLDVLGRSNRLFQANSFSNDVPARVAATAKAAEPAIILARRLGPAVDKVAAATTPTELEAAVMELARAWGSVRTAAAVVDGPTALHLLDACSHAILARAVDLLGLRGLLVMPLTEARTRVAQFAALRDRWSDGDAAAPSRDGGGGASLRLRQLFEQSRQDAGATRLRGGSSAAAAAVVRSPVGTAVFLSVRLSAAAAGGGVGGPDAGVVDDSRALTAAYGERWAAALALRSEHEALVAALVDHRARGRPSRAAAAASDDSEAPSDDGRVSSALSDIAAAWARLVGGSQEAGTPRLDPSDVTPAGNAAWAARTQAYAEAARHVDELLGAALAAGVERAGESGGSFGSKQRRMLDALAAAQQLLARRGRALAALKPIQLRLLSRIKVELLAVQVSAWSRGARPAHPRPAGCQLAGEH